MDYAGRFQDLINRWSQPLAVAMRTFDFVKQFPELAELAATSGGSAPSLSMAKRVVCIAGLLLAAFVSHAVAADERRVTAREAEAIAIALADFKSKQGSKIDGRPVYGDLRHYSLVLERQGNRLHIVFMPEDVPLKPNEAGTGGSTKYGWAVDYYISLSRLKITDLHYER